MKDRGTSREKEFSKGVSKLARDCMGQLFGHSTPFLNTMQRHNEL